MNFEKKKVVIMGLGNYKDGSGISAALYFLRNNAKLLITDLKTRKELAPQIKRLKKFNNIKYVLGKHQVQDFKNADFIFKNPSVPKNSPYLKIAKKNKIPIINDWTIYFQERPGNLLIGITGTKGKSTTATLIYQILKAANKDAILCGNIGQSPLSILNKIKNDTIVIAELSSWLLHEFEFFKKSPQISIITNLMPDHLDKYKNIKEYYADKENIFKFQKPSDYLVLNKEDKNLQKFAKQAKSKIIWFSQKTKGGVAIAVAKILGIPESIVQKTIKNFKGAPGRLELIVEKNGVKYYNDTTATTPDAAIFALNSLGKYKGRIILIAGGVDKKLDYKNLAGEIKKYCKALILFKGTASEKILKSLRVTGRALRKNMKSMEEAVKIARRFAKKKDIILLSPAAASFNMFKNEFDRGNQFNKFVKLLK